MMAESHEMYKVTGVSPGKNETTLKYLKNLNTSINGVNKAC